MIRVVGIRFRRGGKLYFFDPSGLELHMGNDVIVETTRGMDMGEVVLPPCEMPEDKVVQPLKKAVRLATEQDRQSVAENIANEKSAHDICTEKITTHKLEMKLVDVEYTFDKHKIIFYFTANGRVDFRALVKDLASVFKTRIELRQIGVRDEAKMLGGLGPCGRQICCRAFLSEFQPVSIKMAKEQSLSLNPTKISGLCGRLMCCLKYEQDTYEKMRKRMPRPGKEILTPDGPGTVLDINVLKETVRVRIPKGDGTEVNDYPVDDCARPAQQEPREKQNGPQETPPRAETAPAPEGRGRGNRRGGGRGRKPPTEGGEGTSPAPAPSPVQMPDDEDDERFSD